MESKYDKQLKELDKKIRTLKLKQKEQKYKVIKETLYKNDKYFTENDVQKIEELILNILSEKTDRNSSKSIKKSKNREMNDNINKILKEEPDKFSSENLEERKETTLPKEKIEKSVEAPIPPLEIYLYFKKSTEENHEVYAVSSENELMTKEIIYIKYENISAPIRELCCFIEYLKNINALQKQEELKIVKVSRLYIDNLFIVNNWTSGVVKENQNEVIKELIPVATALRKEFEDLGGELVYVKPKENTARIYYKENIEE